MKPIIAQEIERLQNIFKKNNIEETIIDFSIKRYKTQNVSIICVKFKEKFETYRGTNNKKVNKWISLKIADNQHLVSNGISICNPIAGGTIESERETWVNYQKIKNILINEYWIFLQELDLVFNRSIKYVGGDENKLAQFFYDTYNANCYAFPEKVSSYSLEEHIDNFNSLITKELINEQPLIMNGSYEKTEVKADPSLRLFG